METRGQYTVFSPSITLSSHSVLSVEEKFQGGTGINLTPPPPSLISHDQLLSIQSRIAIVAKRFNIENYGRIDVFFNRQTEEMVLIEINTLPALTPSTVLFHQALAQTPSMSPLQLLETIISLRDKSVDQLIASPTLV